MEQQNADIKLEDDRLFTEMCGCVAGCVCLQFLCCQNASGHFTTLINFAERSTHPQENMGRFKGQQIHDLHGSGCSWHSSFSAIVKFAFTVNAEKKYSFIAPLLLSWFCGYSIFDFFLFFLKPFFPKNLQPT